MSASKQMQKHKRIRAFTLIELLVVVAIIAVLISILLPSLNGARKQARAVKCGANLKDVGGAFAIYLAENNGTYPVSYAYAKDYDGGWDTSDDTQTPPATKGYVQWSWFLYRKGAVNDEVFRCPEFEKGGVPRTNPGPERANWMGGQRDDAGQTTTGSVEDKQARWLAYTANEAIVPRNNFSLTLSGGTRYSIFVNESRIREQRGVVLVTEFSNDWRDITQNDGQANLPKSHRPVSPFYNRAGGTEYEVLPGGQNFRYGPANDKEFMGLLKFDKWQNQDSMIDGSADNNIMNAVGRHHPGGDKLGGTVNFMYTDGSVQRKPVLRSLQQREWGSRYYSLNGGDKALEVMYDQN